MDLKPWRDIEKVYFLNKQIFDFKKTVLKSR